MESCDLSCIRSSTVACCIVQTAKRFLICDCDEFMYMPLPLARRCGSLPIDKSPCEVKQTICLKYDEFQWTGNEIDLYSIVFVFYSTDYTIVAPISVTYVMHSIDKRLNIFTLFMQIKWKVDEARTDRLRCVVFIFVGNICSDVRYALWNNWQNCCVRSRCPMTFEFIAFFLYNKTETQKSVESMPTTPANTILLLFNRERRSRRRHRKHKVIKWRE